MPWNARRKMKAEKNSAWHRTETQFDICCSRAYCSIYVCTYDCVCICKKRKWYLECRVVLVHVARIRTNWRGHKLTSVRQLIYSYTDIYTYIHYAHIEYTHTHTSYWNVVQAVRGRQNVQFGSELWTMMTPTPTPSGKWYSCMPAYVCIVCVWARFCMLAQMKIRMNRKSEKV